MKKAMSGTSQAFASYSPAIKTDHISAWDGTATILCITVPKHAWHCNTRVCGELLLHYGDRPHLPILCTLLLVEELTLQAAISSGQGESGLPACQVEASSPWLVVGVRPGARWHVHAAHCLAGPAGRHQQQENCPGRPSVMQPVHIAGFAGRHQQQS